MWNHIPLEKNFEKRTLKRELIWHSIVTVCSGYQCHTLLACSSASTGQVDPNSPTKTYGNTIVMCFMNSSQLMTNYVNVIYEKKLCSKQKL